MGYKPGLKPSDNKHATPNADFKFHYPAIIILGQTPPYIFIQRSGASFNEKMTS